MQTGSFLRRAVTGLVSWALVFSALLLSVLTNAPGVRYRQFFTDHPGLLLALCLALLAVGLWLLWGYLRRSVRPGRRRPSWGALLCTAWALPMAALAMVAGLTNFDYTRLATRKDEARFSFDPASGVLHVVGPIGVRFEHRMRQAFEAHPDIRRVRIASFGGEIVPAERIGRFLRERKVPVQVRGKCASACAHLWALSHPREMTRRSVLGLHALRRDIPLPSDVTRMMADSRGRKTHAIFRAAGFPTEMVARGAATPHDKILWLAPAELAEAGVDLAIVAD